MPENKPYLPRLIATSVVRGSEQGDSHGGIFSVDFDKQEAFQHVDWNTSDIDFSGRGWDRGLRGIEFYNDEIYIAASDELFVYGQDFQIRRYPEQEIRFSGIDDSKIARQGFGRGLCPLSDRFIAGGSSPSTIAVYDLYSNKTVVSVNLSMDIRNAIHGLEVWPYG